MSIRFPRRRALRVPALMLAGAALALGGGIAGAAVAQAGSAPLVYICPDSQGTPPADCVNGQEFEVFDYRGAPIFSVPEAGTLGSFGTGIGVFGTSVFTPDTVIAAQTPVQYYGTASCSAPAGGELWIDSGGNGEFWTCLLGTWMRHGL